MEIQKFPFCTQSCCVYIKLKKLTDVWQVVLAPAIRKIACQNMNILLPIDKWAAHTLRFKLKQVSGLFLPASSMAMCSH